MIRLNCFIAVEEPKRQIVLDAAVRLTEASLKQDGCIAYDIFESATRKNVLMICETWKDQKALDAHSASDVFKKEVEIIQKNAELKLESFEFPAKKI